MSTLRTFFPPVTPATQPFMQVQDQKPTGTAGQILAVGDNTLELNTVLHDNITGASLSGNQVTLPIGTYSIEAISGLYKSNATTYSAIEIKDSAGSVLITGFGGRNITPSGTALRATHLVNGQIILPATTAILINGIVSIAAAMNSPSSLGEHELYTDLRIWQIKEGV